MRRVGTIVLAVTFGLAALAGCGGGEPATDASKSSQPVAQAEKSTEPEAKPVETEASKPAPKAAPENAAFCAELKKVGTDFMSQQSGDLAEMATKYEKLAELAPAEVKQEWTTVADAMKTVAEAQEQMKKDPASVDTKKMTEATNKMQPALQKISSDTMNRCMAG